MPGAFIVFFILIAVLIVAGAIFGSQAAKKRTLALQALCRARDWQFSPGHVSSLERRFGEFSCFRQGSDRYGYNVMRGEEDGRDIWAFDYHYTTTSTDSKGNTSTHHHHFSSVVVDSGLDLEPLGIRTEGFLDKMKGVFGFDDIDFESAAFNRAFWVTAKDKRWAYDVVHQETMEFLLESPRFILQLDGPYVLARRGAKLKPQEFQQALRLATGILDRIPADVAKERRA